MKILKISDVFFPRINGVSTSVGTLRDELLRRGHQVMLVAPGYGVNGVEPEAGVHRVEGRRVPLDPEDRIMLPGALRRLRPRLLASGFDLVHVHTPFVAHREGIRLGRALGVPVVETYHTYFEEYFHHYVPFLPRPLLGWLARRLARSQCGRVARVVVPSQAMKRVLERYRVRSKVEVIPTGLSFGELSGGDRHRFRSRYRIDPERPVLLHVGRMAFEKNVSFLIRMLPRVLERSPEALLVLAGEGPALSRIEAQVRELGLSRSVLFVGYLSRDGALQDCYAAADLFVFASRTETQGLVLLEAMALSLPVVSTSVMGTADIVGPQRGAVVAREEIVDFSDKVSDLLADPVGRSEIAREAEVYSREWSIEAMTDRMLGLYGEVVAHPSGSR